MKKFINLFFLLLAMTTMSLISCSKNDIDNDSEFDIPEGNRELYDQITSELHDYLYLHEGATIEDIQEQLKKYSTSVTSEVKDNILYLKIDSVYEYLCDPYNMTCPVGEEDYTEIYEENDKFLAEIHDALYTDGATHTRNDNTLELFSEKSPTRTVQSGNELIMTKKNIFVWDPWNNIRSDFNVTAQTVPGKTLSDMEKFCNYDIVLIICHGTSDGRIAVPKNDIFFAELDREGLKLNRDYTEKSDGTGADTKEAYILKESALRKLLHCDLSNTIIWTSMCFSNVSGSVLRKVAYEELKAAAFAGADNEVYMNGKAQCWLRDFSNLFYKNPCYAENYIKKVFDANSLVSPITVNFDEVKKEYFNYFKSHVKCKYSFVYRKNIIYRPLVEAMSQINNQPRASVTMPYELYSEYHSASATRVTDLTRASSVSNISVGFCIKNKETGEVKEIDFSSSTVKLYQSFDYKKMIARIEVLGNTDGLEPGTYEYRTYLEIDGEKEYSDEIFEFTITKYKRMSCPDGNHPHMIDLGLPSGTRWACCNLGANMPAGFGFSKGGQYAWGKPDPYEDTYAWGFNPRDYYGYNEVYGTSKEDRDVYTYIGKNISGTEYDAAYVYNNSLRMPTKEDVEELIESCVFIIGPICKIDGGDNSMNRGIVAIGPNDNKITFSGTCGWTATLSDEESTESPILSQPRENGVSGSAYSFVIANPDASSIPLDNNVYILLTHNKDDEIDKNTDCLKGMYYTKPFFVPRKRYNLLPIRPVSR